MPMIAKRYRMHVDRRRERLQRRADDDDRGDRVEEAADDQEHERDEEADTDEPQAPGRHVLEQRLRDLEVGEQPSEHATPCRRRTGRRRRAFRFRATRARASSRPSRGRRRSRGPTAYSTAAAADSVAVNQPSRMPPTMMNGVISAGTETAAAVRNSLKRRARVRRIMADLGVDVDGGHLRETDQQSRDDAGEIERANRHGQHAAPDDHQDRRRDDHRKHGRHRGDRDREREVVAFLDLGLDEDLALARGVSGRRPGNAGEEDRQQHVDLCERRPGSCRPSFATG